MKKEEIKRDKNGRFVKKSVEPKKAAKSKKDAAPKCELFAFPSKDDGGTSAGEYIEQLENERDMFKYLAERFGSDYLNKCVEIAKLKKRYEKLDSLRTVAMKGLRLAVQQNNWLQGHLGFFKNVIYRRQLRAMDEDVYFLLEKAEGFKS